MWEEENKKERTQISLSVQSYWEIHTPEIFNALSPPGAIKRLDYLLLLLISYGSEASRILNPAD